jgi:flagellar motor switch protein FliG
MMQKTSGKLAGTRRVAVVLASLPREVAAAVLARLDRAEAQAVSIEIARLVDLPEGATERALREFVTDMRSGEPVLMDGAHNARELLRSALPAEEAAGAVSRLEETLGRVPFEFLAGVDAAALAAHLRDEQPQTVALVLAHVPPAKAARVIEGLSARAQGEVVRRIAHLRDASPEAIKRVEEELAGRIGDVKLAARATAGGAELAADILRRAGRSVERSALDSLEYDEPQLADDLRKRLFAFEDLLRADDRGMRALLKEVTTQDLAVALKTASDELEERVFANLSARACEVLREEIEYMRPVRLSEVEAAQARVLDAARRLEDAGELLVAGRASKEDFIV